MPLGAWPASDTPTAGTSLSWNPGMAAGRAGGAASGP